MVKIVIQRNQRGQRTGSQADEKGVKSKWVSARCTEFLFSHSTEHLTAL